mmetsp:Transcript_26088/g.60897  ORF Transcript_26088/g.60897 Transcript_26088/m.60897 type:complete len:360 (+) Transcript_26088:1280-2359(+)
MSTIGQYVKGVGRTGAPNATNAAPLTADHEEPALVLGHRGASSGIGQGLSIPPHVAIGVVDFDGLVRLTMAVDVRISAQHVSELAVRQSTGHGPLGVHVGHPLPHHALPPATGAVQPAQRAVLLQGGGRVDPDDRPLRHVQLVVSAGDVQIFLIDETGCIGNNDVRRECAQVHPVLTSGIVHFDFRYDVVAAVSSADDPDCAGYADADVPMARPVHLVAGAEPVRFGIVERHLVRYFCASVLRLGFGLGFAGRDLDPVEGIWVEIRDVVRLTSADEVDARGDVSVGVRCHAERHRQVRQRGRQVGRVVRVGLQHLAVGDECVGRGEHWHEDRRHDRQQGQSNRGGRRQASLSVAANGRW